MTTRRAKPGSAFRQERYLSSPALERGLLANCVARRLSVVQDADQRALIWWLQLISQESGALDRLAQRIISEQPERFVTRAMRTIAGETSHRYSQGEIGQLRMERELRGILADGEMMDAFGIGHDRPAEPELPVTAGKLQEHCRRVAQAELSAFLFQEFCLNPAVKPEEGVWYCPDLLNALRQARHEWTQERTAKAPVTTVGAMIHDALDYALAKRRLAFIDGVSSIGKTFAVTQWIARHPGEARYVQVPSSGDDGSFFRAIANSLGVSASQVKAVELRERIETTLHGGDLMLILDEAHYALPSRNCSRQPVPHRINWICTQLVNLGVAVALVTTPQFTKSQKALVKMGGWDDAQLIKRIRKYCQLPAELPADELEKVARFYLPAGDAKSIEILVNYAIGSQKYLQAIESVVECAEYAAEKDGRSEVSRADIVAALKESVIPSDSAMASAIAGRRAVKRDTLQAHCSADAAGVQTSRGGVAFTAPDRSRGTDTAALLPT